MQTGQEKHGMQTFNQCLATLYFQKKINLQTALSMSSNVEELQDMINRGTGISGAYRPSAATQRANRTR
jgi:twitching motility protein PilT